MYIHKLRIENIKGISELVINFSDFRKPGWHVLIGDNGSGKTTILRALGMAMLGEPEVSGILARPDMAAKNWVRNSIDFGTVRLWKDYGSEYNIQADFMEFYRDGVIRFAHKGTTEKDLPLESYKDPEKQFNEHVNSLFISGYGPFRRFSKNQDSIFATGKRQFFGTLFSENEGIAETQKWIQDLALDSISIPSTRDLLSSVIAFINQTNLLPKGIELTDDVNSNGIKLKSEDGQTFYFQEASDGIRSILSLAIDMIRNLVSIEGKSEDVEKMLRAGVIDFPGVVLIDEVDAHLHPTWQIRIGNWFRKHFPKVQFIVTTHSPLICRAAKDSLIYRLVPEGSSEKSGPVSEVYHNRLVYGDILDAYGTQTFGDNITNSEAAVDYRKRITVLNMKSITGTITSKESKELQNLKKFIQA